MNTVIALIHALTAIPNDLPLDRIGTHPLENFFGLLRRILHDCNKFDELLHAAARNVIVNEILADLDADRTICGRANTAGVVSAVSDEDCHEIDFDDEEIDKAITELIHLSITHASELTDNAHLGMRWLTEFNRISMTSLIEKGINVSIRGASASRIMALNIWSNQT
jgi:hypothetical protein